MYDKKVFLASQLQYYIKMLGYNISDIWVDELLKYADRKLVDKIDADYKEQKLSLTPEDFIFYSESIFSEEEKRSRGIAYTPVIVANQIIELSISQLKEIDKESFKMIDPAVGGGIFLVLVARMVSRKTDIPVNQLIEKNLFGIDIVSENIILTRVALILLALEGGYELPTRFNLIEYDTFRLNDKKIAAFFELTKFDLVITNPPYIRSKNLTSETREFLKGNFKTVYGIVDSYIPFFEVVINLLAPGGVATLITPNSFFTSLNGSRLREFLIEEGRDIRLINFTDQQLFEGISSYSAVTSIVKKSDNSQGCKIQYLIEPFLNNDFLNKEKKKWQNVKQQKTWRTLGPLELNIINKLESVFTTQLKDLKFKNGIATQRNNLYSFIVESESEGLYHFNMNGTAYKIEKGITRPFITPNEKIQPINQKIIFPYKFNTRTGKNEVIPEEIMKDNYPLAYRYLLTQKNELDQRASDKGIPAWYAYGRSQGLNDFGNRMYLPYMAKRVHTIVSDNNAEIFAAGYAIFEEDLDYLMELSDILTSSIFSFYIAMVSKPYSKGYYSTAKSLVQYFSVPIKGQSNKQLKINLSDDEIFDLYKLTYEEKELVLATVKSF